MWPPEPSAEGQTSVANLSSRDQLLISICQALVSPLYNAIGQIHHPGACKDGLVPTGFSALSEVPLFPEALSSQRGMC